MTSAVDQKTYWGIGESLMWIRIRDHERIAEMSEMNEEEAMTMAMFAFKAQWDGHSLRGLTATTSDADRDAIASQDHRKSLRIDGSIPMPLDQALDDLHRKLRSCRLPLTAIRCDVNSSERMPVPPFDLNDLIVRLAPGGPSVAAVGLWSRSRDILVWRSPQFLRADVIRIWPVRNTKTTAVSGAILRHLRQITTSLAPLTKLEAQQRCMAEVPNAYPEAFKRAWLQLDPTCKKGRGKHGPRVD
jgi:hypothetical protein